MDQVAASSLSYSLCIWLSVAVWRGSWQEAGEITGWSEAICFFIVWAHPGESKPLLSSLEPVPLGMGAREVSIPCLLALRFTANRCILRPLCGGDRNSFFHWSHSLEDPWFRAILLLTESEEQHTCMYRYQEPRLSCVISAIYMLCLFPSLSSEDALLSAFRTFPSSEWEF